MPASSEIRNRWRKRKRGEQPRKPKPQPQNHHEDDDDDYDDEDDPDLDQQPQHSEFDDDPNNSSDPSAAAGTEREVISDGAVRVSAFPSVIKHTVNQHHYSVIQIVAMERAGQAGESSSCGKNDVVFENISHGQLQALSSLPADSPALTGADSEGSFVITPPPLTEGRGVIKRYGLNRVHVVPMHADWFAPTSVHRLERQAVPHFFSGKSTDHTPEKYIDIRNRIVAKYMENPARRLSASDCPRFLIGVDADDITRVVRFLENWGVINYCAARPSHCDPKNEGSYLTEDSKGELRVPATFLQSIDSLIQFDRPKCRLKAADVCPELVAHSDENSDLDSRLHELLSENQCSNCSRPLAVRYYQSKKEIDVLLCLDCFNAGAFIVGHSSLDFIKVDSNRFYGDLEGDSWTNQETLLLLEAMERFNENWIRIAEHVGTKSKAQCILQFIRLSVDETPLENIEVPVASSLSNGDSRGRPHPSANGKGSIIDDPDHEDGLPFKKSGNPVMSQVAFLASAVGPRVAAACAHASLAALSEDDTVARSEIDGVVDGSVSENRMNSEIMNGRDGCPPVQGAKSQDDADAASISSDKIRNAVRAGLAAAAIKAKLFADHEEREIQRLSANIINHQLKRLELKLKQFAEVETLLMKECEQVERARQRISSERALMLSSQFGSSGVTRPAGMPGVSPPLVNNNSGSLRQQVSGATSPAFISGYPNIQPTRPQPSQQPMYGLGPRLPLSAINASPSSSSPSHPMLRSVSGNRSSFE